MQPIDTWVIKLPSGCRPVDCLSCRGSKFADCIYSATRILKSARKATEVPDFMSLQERVVRIKGGHRFAGFSVNNKPVKIYAVEEGD